MKTSSSSSEAQAAFQSKQKTSSRFQEIIDKIIKDYGPASLYRRQEDVFASYPV